MKELLVRSLSGLVYICVLAGGIYYSKQAFYALFFVLMLFCVFEFKKLIKLHNYWIFITASIAYVAATDLFFQYSKYLYFLLIIVLFLPFIVELFTVTRTRTENLGKFFLALMYIVLPFVILINIPTIKEVYQPNIVFGIFTLIWAGDTFAYLVGSTLGRTKLFQRVSPKKTVEGAVGGLVASLALGYVLSLYFKELSTVEWIIVASITSVFGLLGDLIESKFKREAGVKDTSNFIPGHGGFLDRLDSVIFVAPFVFAYLQLINL